MAARNFDFTAFSIEDSKLPLYTTKTRRVLEIDEPFLLRDTEAPSITLSNEEIEEATRIRLFCEANELTFFGNLSGISPDPEGIFARTSLLTPFQMITYGFIVQLEDGWLELGQLRLARANQYTKAKRFLYAKYSSSTQLPTFCIDARESLLQPSQTSGMIRYETESNEFNHHFHLYTPHGHTQEALAILTPNVMAILIDYFANTDIDIHDGQLFCVFDDTPLTLQTTIEEIMMTVSTLHATLRPVKASITRQDLPQTAEKYLEKYHYTHLPLVIQKKNARDWALKATAVSIFLGLILAGLAIVYALSR